ncbi:MAG: dodecin family protein [Bacteroidia bacterium]|nr:dodecin family protein [Bacteroidia bacterium]
MAVLKAIELLASSEKSWEDATAQAVKKASKTLMNVRSANVANQSVTVKNGKIREYRVNVNVVFELE